MWRAFVFSALVCGAWAASCSTTARCYAYNCDGCCDMNDVCQTGDAVGACGFDGISCAQCGLGQACTVGQCTGTILDGGARVDGGVVCTGANCSGCCDALGRCVGGSATGACGLHSSSCTTCGSGQICKAGACESGTCTGCFGDAGCEPGNTNVGCGKNGSVCQVCPAGQTCFNSTCVSSVTCGPANCSGCCQGTTCVSPSTAAACGTNGVTCVACGSGSSCNAGSCSATGGGAGGGGSGGGSSSGCSLLSCAGGCCDGDGNCQPGDDRDVCGLGASSCENCVVACFAGQCLPF